MSSESPAKIAKPKKKRKPKMIALIRDNCTGCSGAPVCLNYCPVKDCMNLVDDGDTIFGIVTVNPATCTGCKKCVTAGTDGMVLDGCPWDAIDMVPTEEFENEFGPYDQDWDIPEAIMSSTGDPYK